jgi:hypothetical protein
VTAASHSACQQYVCWFAITVEPAGSACLAKVLPSCSALISMCLGWLEPHLISWAVCRLCCFSAYGQCGLQFMLRSLSDMNHL